MKPVQDGSNLSPLLEACCDIGLKAVDEMVPAAGGIRVAVRINPDRMAILTGAKWIDVCEDPGMG